MKVTLLEPKVTKVGEKKVIYKLPWRLNFTYCEGNRVVREQLISTIKLILGGLGIPLSGVVVGEAKCHEGDTFDFDYGKALAESRAKAKIFKMFKRVSYCLKGYFGSLMDGFDASFWISSDNLNKEVHHLEKMENRPEEWIKERDYIRGLRRK